MARKLLVTDQTARLIIAGTAGFVGVRSLIPAEGQQFALPPFTTGLLTTYLPLTVAALAFMRVPGISRETQSGLLVVLTAMMVGTNVFSVILGGEFTVDNVVGSVAPALATLELAV